MKFYPTLIAVLIVCSQCSPKMNDGFSNFSFNGRFRPKLVIHRNNVHEEYKSLKRMDLSIVTTRDSIKGTVSETIDKYLLPNATVSFENYYENTVKLTTDIAGNFSIPKHRDMNLIRIEAKGFLPLLIILPTNMLMR